MNYSCAICCSRFNTSDDIFATQCGHVFHFPCLSQWLERSKTCPQCRERTSQSKIHRLYFNISNNDSVMEDATSLQEKLDNLQFQMLLKEKDVTDFRKMASQAQVQVAGLRKEVLKLEAEMEQKNSALHALKIQAKHFKQTSDEGLRHKEEADKLRRRLADAKDLQTILTASNEEADQLIDSAEDPRKLAIYVSTLKRELTAGMKNRSNYRNQIRELLNKLKQAEVEKLSLVEQLKKATLADSTLNQIQRENETLKKRLETISKPQTNSTSETAKSKKSGRQPIKSSLPVAEYHSASEQDDSDNDEENLPNLRCKVQNLAQSTKRGSRDNSSSLLSKDSILAKKPRLGTNLTACSGPKNDTYTWDGLGGLTKIEHYPTGDGVRKKPTVRKQKGKESLENIRKIESFIDLTQT